MRIVPRVARHACFFLSISALAAPATVSPAIGTPAGERPALVLAQAGLPAPEKRNPSLPRPLRETGPQPSPGWMTPSPTPGQSLLRDDRRPGIGQPTIGQTTIGRPSSDQALLHEAKRYGQRFTRNDLNFRRDRCSERASRFGLFGLDHQKFVTACMFPW